MIVKDSGNVFLHKSKILKKKIKKKGFGKIWEEFFEMGQSNSLWEEDFAWSLERNNISCENVLVIPPKQRGLLC